MLCVLWGSGGDRQGEGDVVRPFRSGEDRVGAVVVGAETPAATRKLADELVESVKFEVESA